MNAARELQALQDEAGLAQAAPGQPRGRRAPSSWEQAEPLDAELRDLRRPGGPGREATAPTAARRGRGRAVAADLERVLAERERPPWTASRAALLVSTPACGASSGAWPRPSRGHNCGGCHLTLSSVEVDRIRKTPAGAMLHYEEAAGSWSTRRDTPRPVLIIVRHGRTAANAQAPCSVRGPAPGRRRSCPGDGARSGAAADRRIEPAAAWRPGARPEVEVEVDERWIEPDYGDMEGTLTAEVPVGRGPSGERTSATTPRAGSRCWSSPSGVGRACEDLVADARTRRRRRGDPRLAGEGGRRLGPRRRGCEVRGAPSSAPRRSAASPSVRGDRRCTPSTSRPAPRRLTPPGTAPVTFGLSAPGARDDHGLRKPLGEGSPPCRHEWEIASSSEVTGSASRCGTAR